MNIQELWEPWETNIESFEDAIAKIEQVASRHDRAEDVLVWRGQVNADWALYSSLFRRMTWQNNSPPTEIEQARKEKEILVRLHQWGLHMKDHTRLSVLRQLALLQHYGAPTRLIDVTFNAFIGLWFAVEKKEENGVLKEDDKDGRLFVFNVKKQIINEEDELRFWEDDLRRPWPKVSAPSLAINDEDTLETKQTKENELKRLNLWKSNIYCWKAPHFDARISAQNGGFIFGGVPSKSTWKKDPSNDRNLKWKIDDFKKASCIAVSPNKLSESGGRIPNNAMYSFRIKSEAKPQIRKRLEEIFGYKHSTIYPDYSGFADFAVSDLRKSHPSSSS